MMPRRTSVALFVVVVAGGLGILALRAEDDSACERYEAVAAEFERAERGHVVDMSFEQVQRQTAEALAACMREEAAAAG